MIWSTSSLWLEKTKIQMKGENFIYRVCPFCGDTIRDLRGRPSTFIIHLGETIPTHISNRAWLKIEDEKNDIGKSRINP